MESFETTIPLLRFVNLFRHRQWPRRPLELLPPYQGPPLCLLPYLQGDRLIAVDFEKEAESTATPLASALLVLNKGIFSTTSSSLALLLIVFIGHKFYTIPKSHRNFCYFCLPLHSRQLLKSPSATMARRFSADEKGKSIAGNPTGPPRIRIRAPDFDPSELIKDNCFTVVGRLTNAREQRMSSVLPYLAKKWSVDPAAGADLGRDCFQFRLENEEEIQEVLRNRPYQFGRWMIIVQRWEPLISPSFPSQIPFWITIRGLPLHYWHEKVVRNIGLELGELDMYIVTRSSARIRLVVDELKPLPMDPTLDFDSGEESMITLEYESLGNHCSYCYRLSHLQSQCPEKPRDEAKSQDSFLYGATKRMEEVVDS